MTQFLLNHEPMIVTDHPADLTLLNYLRDDRRLCGTKEGCASGDCGACTLVLARPDGDSLRYTAINSCITLLGAVDGCQVITVEHLAQGHQLHPVQQAMVDHHASQCGFCTPGFVMSLFALYKDDRAVDVTAVQHALSGNLCRCTGYRPILDAALSACARRRPDQFDARMTDTLAQLDAMAKRPVPASNYHRPASRAHLRRLRQQYPSARLVAGSTDLALDITQQLQAQELLIDISQLPDLRQLRETPDGLYLGAALTFSELEPQLLSHYPELEELLSRLGSRPIRNRGTLGGNLATASPIGDSAPALLALGARVVLDNGERRRQLPLADFFTGYRRTRLAADEWIEAVCIPPRPRSGNYWLRAYKVAKRYDDDIATVCAVFSLHLDQGQVQAFAAGFGGVAATPASVPALAQRLSDRPWQESTTGRLGENALGSAFSPIDDVRASAEYRQQLLVNLWRRFRLETQSRLPLRAAPVALAEGNHA